MRQQAHHQAHEKAEQKSYGDLIFHAATNGSAGQHSGKPAIYLVIAKLFERGADRIRVLIARAAH
jgi:hypothetical protein